ncbi:hypothetical protein CBR_g8758 [Chara braunii]|uniref:Uncharacterized protein n=1 Tax=Chara braunii TaxID=69332 RepID=A0A388KMS0_CHABU|nr:hypothetical protein CBR_g8758 [Chara braunii]|eukprot:GBG71337.1 hypothetical protein CBR_g8758 [Chara braunii]
MRCWGEHLNCIKKGGTKRGRIMYNWLGKVGFEKYVAIPVYFCRDRAELEVVERTLIRTWSPSLNTRGAKKKTRKRRRKGKKERRGQWVRKVGTMGNNIGQEGKILELRTFSGSPAVRIVDFLRNMVKQSHGTGVEVLSNGGKTWSDGWRVVRRLFGGTCIVVGRKTRPLRKCKRLLETEGRLVMRDVVEALPRTLKMKQDLIGMFKNKRKRKRLFEKTVDELVSYYGAAKLFSEKGSRTRARRMLSDVFRRKFGMNVRRRIIVKVEYDDRVRKSEVVRLVRSGVGRLQLTRSVVGMVRRRARVVWTRSQNVGEILHNHRRYAADGVFGCTCIDMSFPRLGGHVHFRLGELTECPDIARNAKNVPRDGGNGVLTRLAKELSNAVDDVSWLGKDVGKISFSLEEVGRCVGRSGADTSGDLTTVRQLAARLDGLVRTPLDRNPGDKLVMCPFVYGEAMKATFVENDGYEVCERKEGVILSEIRGEF